MKAEKQRIEEKEKIEAELDAKEEAEELEEQMRNTKSKERVEI